MRLADAHADQSSSPATFKAGTQERTMTTQEATPAFQQNLEKLCRIIEESFHIGRLTITDQSTMCDFPAYQGAIEKVSTAVEFEVQEGDLLVDIARRMA